jgi:hypothetical protein
MLMVVVHAANIQDRDGAVGLKRLANRFTANSSGLTVDAGQFIPGPSRLAAG